MPGTNQQAVLDRDLTDSLATIRERVQGTLYAFTEYDAHDINPLYVDDATVAMYDHFEEIHDDVNVDFTEQDLLTDTLFPVADRVEYMITCMDYSRSSGSTAASRASSSDSTPGNPPSRWSNRSGRPWASTRSTDEEFGEPSYSPPGDGGSAPASASLPSSTVPPVGPPISALWLASCRATCRS